LREGEYPSIYTGQEAVLEAIFGAKHALHHLCMSSRNRPMKGWLSSADRGAATPRERPVPDRAPLPPPSHDRPWAIFGAKHALHHLCMSSRNRPMKGWLSSADRGRPPLGSDRSLIRPPCPRLHMIGHGLNMGCSLRVFCPF
jgi:hypothetical protein